MNVTQIRAVALDVDGVLTDGTFWWGQHGEEFRRFSFVDVMGVSRGRRAGLVFALITGEDVPQIDRYAAKMGITDVFKACRDKAAALRQFAETHGFELSEVAFMGDDVNDVPAMQIAGLPAAPADAMDSVLQVAKIVTRRCGGRGAVRELIDHILCAREDSQCP